MQNSQDASKGEYTGPVPPQQSSVEISNPIGETYQHNMMGESCSCGKQECTCGSETSYVYAIGKVIHYFPDESSRRQLAQIIGRKPEAEKKGLTYEELEAKALSDPHPNNRAIASKMCYVLTIEGFETYILVPNIQENPSSEALLPHAVRPEAGPGDMDVVVGIKKGRAPPQKCLGRMYPIVIVDQMFSFDRDALIKSIPKRKGVSEEQFKKTSGALLNRIMQLADNAGATDEHRAINYLAVSYDEIYYKTQSMQDEDYSFTGIDTRLSRLSGDRKVVDVIFTYESRAERPKAPRRTCVRVDVTREFPYLDSYIEDYVQKPEDRR